MPHRSSKKIVIVDENDRFLGLKDKKDLKNPGEIYRSAALWITNSKNEILLCRRAASKKLSPNLWGPAGARTF